MEVHYLRDSYIRAVYDPGEFWKMKDCLIVKSFVVEYFEFIQQNDLHRGRSWRMNLERMFV